MFIMPVLDSREVSIPFHFLEPAVSVTIKIVLYINTEKAIYHCHIFRDLLKLIGVIVSTLRNMFKTNEFDISPGRFSAR